MATLNFSLQEPYKRSENQDRQKAKEENKKIKEEIKERRKNDKPILSLLNPRETRIYLFLIIDRDNKLKLKTDETILPKDWDFKNKRVKQSYPGSVEFNTRLQNLKNDVSNAYRKLINDNSNISFLEISDNLKSFVKSGHIPTKDNSFIKVYEDFILTKSEVNNPRTIQKYNTLLFRLTEFQNRKNIKLTFDSIDLKFYDEFKHYLLTIDNVNKPGMKGLLNDTIAKYFKTLKYFMKWSLDRGFHKNLTFKHEDFKATERPNNEIVTLTEPELIKLYKLDLSKNNRLEQVRDLFCFACFTGQRWSDIANFNKRNIKGDEWIFESVKTKKVMKIPLIGYCSPAKDILTKYDYELPKISSQKFNYYIKEAAKLAGLDREVIIKRYSGNKVIEIKKPLHQFIASHMARRSAVTILLEQGVPPTTVQKLTGHADIKTVMKYANISNDALVRELERVGDINKPMLKAV